MLFQVLKKLLQVSSRSGKRILFVDDELLLVEMTKMMLERIRLLRQCLNRRLGGAARASGLKEALRTTILFPEARHY